MAAAERSAERKSVDGKSEEPNFIVLPKLLSNPNLLN